MSPLTEPTKLTLAKTSYPDIRNGIVTSGLVLNLDAAQTASYPGTGTTWTDLSGNGNNGTLVNGPTYSSANYGSIVFDGSNDYVTIPDSNNWFYSTNDFSIEFWYKFNSIPGASDQYFYSQRVSGGDYVFIFATSTSWVFDAYSASVQGPSISSAVTHGTTNWNQLCLSRIGTSFSLYLNAQLIGSQTNSFNLTNLSAALDFGRWSGGAGRNINANASSLKIYNTKGLTAAEVQQNFNCLRMRYGL